MFKEESEMLTLFKVGIFYRCFSAILRLLDTAYLLFVRYLLLFACYLIVI